MFVVIPLALGVCAYTKFILTGYFYSGKDKPSIGVHGHSGMAAILEYLELAQPSLCKLEMDGNSRGLEPGEGTREGLQML